MSNRSAEGIREDVKAWVGSKQGRDFIEAMLAEKALEWRGRAETGEAERDRLRDALRLIVDETMDLSGHVDLGEQLDRIHEVATDALAATSTDAEGFYEDDEPVAGVRAAFNAGSKGVMSAPTICATTEEPNP